MSISKVVQFTRRSKSTISRELKRSTHHSGTYYSNYAHKKYIRRKSNSHLFACLNIKVLQNYFAIKIIPNHMALR